MDNDYQKRTLLLDNFLKSYQKRHLFEDGVPMTNTFLVTNRCNLECKHCFNHLNSKDFNELTTDEYELVSKSMSFFASALFCGGEPFIREDLYEIVSIFRKNNNVQWSSATTNGTLTASVVSQLEKICQQDKKRNFVINFSIDGFREQHDYIRGAGVYDKCIETIKEVKKLKDIYDNLNIGIVSALSTINEEIMPDFFEYIADELQPNVINLLLVRQSPRDGELIKNVIPQNYKKAADKLVELHRNGKNGNIQNPLAQIPFSFYKYIYKTLNTNKRTFKCYAGLHGMCMQANGEINVCEVMNDRNCNNYPKTIGNIKNYNYDFPSLWNSQEALNVKKFVGKAQCCAQCTHETEGLLPSIYFEPNEFLDKMRQ